MDQTKVNPFKAPTTGSEQSPALSVRWFAFLLSLVVLSHVILALFVVTSGQPIAKSNFQVAYHLGGPLFLVGASLGSTMNTVIRLLPLALVFAFFFAALAFNAPA